MAETIKKEEMLATHRVLGNVLHLLKVGIFPGEMCDGISEAMQFTGAMLDDTKKKLQEIQAVEKVATNVGKPKPVPAPTNPA